MKVLKKDAPNSLKQTTFDNYKNSTLGIDAYNMIHKGVRAIRQNGYDIKNGDTVVTHVHVVLQKLIAFKKNNITPIYVFDGEYNELKEKILKEREEIYKADKKKFTNAKSEKDKKRYYYTKYPITDTEFDEIRELIEIFGYNYVNAKEEADSQLAYMSQNNQVDYIVSDDMDILAFGGKVLLKNFTIAKKRPITEINLDDVLKELNISYDQFVDMAMLMDCDYCTYAGIGPNKAYKMVKTNQNYKIDKKIKNYFINPVHDKVKIHPNRNIDFYKLEKFFDKFGYEKNYIDKIKIRLEK